MKYYSLPIPAILLALLMFMQPTSCVVGGDDSVMNPGPDIDVVGLAGNQLYFFNAMSPGNVTDITSINGLADSEVVLSIDYRPATGELYGVTNMSRLYVINTMNGSARAVGASAFTPMIEGELLGFDFNPTVDRIRLLTNKGQNLRLNPETGTVVAIDGNVNGAGTPIILASAYTNNFSGATSTTLFNISDGDGMLFRQDPPNNGTQVAIGALGVSGILEASFDIGPNNIALAAISTDGRTRMYSINLNTGIATDHGAVASAIFLNGFAIPTAQVAYAVDNENLLYIFDPSDVDPISKTIMGLQSGEMIVGIDFRPLNGQLYALGSSSRLYTINVSNGAALQVGSGPFTPALSGTSFAFDFNPTVDRIRIMSNTGQNLRAHPETGMVVATDGNLNPGSPMVAATAYANNFAGTSTTTQFTIDHGMNMLNRQDPPNNGTQVPIGPLGIDVTFANGFDIGSMSNNGYAILTTDSSTGIYMINLMSGQATLISTFPKQVSGFSLGTGF